MPHGFGNRIKKNNNQFHKKQVIELFEKLQPLFYNLVYRYQDELFQVDDQAEYFEHSFVIRFFGYYLHTLDEKIKYDKRYDQLKKDFKQDSNPKPTNNIIYIKDVNTVRFMEQKYSPINMRIYLNTLVMHFFTKSISHYNRLSDRNDKYDVIIKQFLPIMLILFRDMHDICIEYTASQKTPKLSVITIPESMEKVVILTTQCMQKVYTNDLLGKYASKAIANTIGSNIDDIRDAVFSNKADELDMSLDELSLTNVDAATVLFYLFHISSDIIVNSYVGTIKNILKRNNGAINKRDVIVETLTQYIDILEYNNL